MSNEEEELARVLAPEFPDVDASVLLSWVLAYFDSTSTVDSLRRQIQHERQQLTGYTQAPVIQGGQDKAPLVVQPPAPVVIDFPPVTTTTTTAPVVVELPPVPPAAAAASVGLPTPYLVSELPAPDPAAAAAQRPAAAAVAPRVPLVGVQINWERRYFDALLRYFSAEAATQRAAGDELSQLAGEFEYVANLYGKVIISEMFLPNSHRTIPAITDINGVAGGTKYQVGWVFFKRPSETELCRATPRSEAAVIVGKRDDGQWSSSVSYVYGGSRPETFSVLKSANAEMRGLDAIYRAYVAVGAPLPRVLPPLTVLIAYRGHRLLASCKLSLSPDTLAHGWDNAGHGLDSALPPAVPELEACWAQLCQRLRVGAVHRIRSQRGLQAIVGPLDCELHRVSAEHYTVVDASRLFPGEMAGQGTQAREQLFKFFRAELLEQLPLDVQLSADTGFAWEHADAQLNQAVDAARRLQRRQIVAFYRDFVCAEQPPWLHLFNLSVELHRYGINCRFLLLMLRGLAPMRHYNSATIAAHIYAGLGQPAPPVDPAARLAKRVRHLLRAVATELLARLFKNVLVELSFHSDNAMAVDDQLHSPFITLAAFLYNNVVRCKQRLPHSAASLFPFAPTDPDDQLLSSAAVLNATRNQHDFDHIFLPTVVAQLQRFACHLPAEPPPSTAASSSSESLLLSSSSSSMLSSSLASFAQPPTPAMIVEQFDELMSLADTASLFERLQQLSGVHVRKQQQQQQLVEQQAASGRHFIPEDLDIRVVSRPLRFVAAVRATASLRRAQELFAAQEQASHARTLAESAIAALMQLSSTTADDLVCLGDAYALLFHLDNGSDALDTAVQMYQRALCAAPHPTAALHLANARRLGGVLLDNGEQRRVCYQQAGEAIVAAMQQLPADAVDACLDADWQHAVQRGGEQLYSLLCVYHLVLTRNAELLPRELFARLRQRLAAAGALNLSGCASKLRPDVVAAVLRDAGAQDFVAVSLAHASVSNWAKLGRLLATTGVRTLDLSATSISEQDLAHVLSPPVAGQLTDLLLDMCAKITLHSLPDSDLSSLRRLSLRGLHQLTRPSLEQVLAKCPQLRLLYLDGCSGLARCLAIDHQFVQLVPNLALLSAIDLPLAPVRACHFSLVCDRPAQRPSASLADAASLQRTNSSPSVDSGRLSRRVVDSTQHYSPVRRSTPFV